MAEQPGSGGSSGGDEWQTPGSGVICPQCGVTVAPGYPRCPKCHGGLPHVPSPLHQAGSQVSGGTTAADSDGGSGIWIVAAIIVLVAGAIALFAVRGRGGDDAEQSAALEVDAGEVADLEPGDESDDPFEAEGDDDGDDDDDTDDTAFDLLEDLNAKLAELRVWSSVERDAGDDSLVRIVSAHCGDDNLRKAVGAYAKALAQVGYVTVRCFSQHGALEYELDL